MEKFYTNTLVIGAGVVGLAIAKEISSKNRETLILEKEAKLVKLPVLETLELFMLAFIINLIA